MYKLDLDRTERSLVYQSAETFALSVEADPQKAASLGYVARAHVSARLAFVSLWLICSLLFLVNPHATYAQSPAGEKLNTSEAQQSRELGLAMLEEMKDNLEEHYYDRKFRGLDLKTRYQAAKDQIKTLNYNWQIFRVLAKFLLDLNDSHTRFILPPRMDHFEYGFTTQMFGDKCFVVTVKKGSDAEAKGLKVGDEILNIGRFTPTRSDLWKIFYLIYKLDPSKTVDLRVRTLDGPEAQIKVAARTMTEKEYQAERKKRKDDKALKPFKCQEINAELTACKLYTFSIGTSQIDKMMKEIGQHQKLILDLRGNGGGYVATEKYLTGYLFDHEVKMAEEVTRKKTEVRMSGSKKDKAFKGELIILVDSNSASAAELLARVVQLEQRGKVIGDTTSGALMTSITLGLFGRLHANTIYASTRYLMSVTIGEIIMKDGNRVEGVGVTPDESIVPTGLALRHKVDPILAHAATRLGGNLTPEQAGEFYFITRKDEDDDDDEGEKEP
jgi:C-terminal processing protease CtpA/Prc